MGLHKPLPLYLGFFIHSMGEEYTAFKKRIEVIDILRGFALAGILYAHMIFWYTGASLPTDVYFKDNSTADAVSIAIFGAFVFGKFFSVFSFLFGLSFFLHFNKNKSKPRHVQFYLWRLTLLFLIGLFHHIIWRGDILAIYAVLGMVLIVFRRLPSIFILFIGLLLVTNIPTHVYEILKLEKTATPIDLPMAEEANRYYTVIQNADFFTLIKENWFSWRSKIYYQLESGRLLMTFGYFLLGFYAGRKEIFTRLKENFLKIKKWNKLAEKAIFFFLFIGLLLYLTDQVSLPELDITKKYKWLSSFLFSLYNVGFTLFIVTGILLLYQKKHFIALLKPMAPMGRMALTNYLLQTFFGLLLFYDFGFDLFQKTSPAVNVILAIGIFYLQLKFSQYWMKKYRNGPIEWLWKKATYVSFFQKQKKNYAVSEFQDSNSL